MIIKMMMIKLIDDDDNDDNEVFYSCTPTFYLFHHLLLDMAGDLEHNGENARVSFLNQDIQVRVLTNHFH